MKGFRDKEIIYPASNEFGIPDLDLSFQADSVVLPFEKWGDRSRSAKIKGSYHFFTDDYKFERVWEFPDQPLRSEAAALVECNFSTGPGQPLAVVLWDIYRKRWLSRYWQDCGMKVFVDLNVHPSFRKYSLLGVPDGWRAYCTRGSNNEVANIISDYDQAKERAGREPLFVVYGGGQLVECLCLDRGWDYVPENMQVKSGSWGKRKGLQLRILEAYT